jgi:[acyl-carrier-protein] S-malonyltransferase
MSKTAFLFAGQGAQVIGMGKDLAEAFPAARDLFDQANTALDYDLSDICFNGPEEALTKTENAQPGIYLVSWVAMKLLQAQVPDLKCDATAGLSLGEFTALAAAGAVSFSDGLNIVRLRGRYMQDACDATAGGMAAIIGLDVEATAAVCSEAKVGIANLNCPGQIVISGNATGIERACELAKEKGAKRALPLKVAGAYHSPLMEVAQTKLEAALKDIDIQTPEVRVIANVTGSAHGDADAIRARLVEQVTGSVRWEESMRLLIADGFTRFIELGPGNALTGFMRRIDKSVQILNVADASSLEKTVSEIAG